MTSPLRSFAKAKELIEELDFQGYTPEEIAFLGACLQSYAINGDLTGVKLKLIKPLEPQP